MVGKLKNIWAAHCITKTCMVPTPWNNDSAPEKIATKPVVTRASTTRPVVPSVPLYIVTVYTGPGRHRSSLARKSRSRSLCVCIYIVQHRGSYLCISLQQHAGCVWLCYLSLHALWSLAISWSDPINIYNLYCLWRRGIIRRVRSWGGWGARRSSGTGSCTSSRNASPCSSAAAQSMYSMHRIIHHALHCLHLVSLITHYLITALLVALFGCPG